MELTVAPPQNPNEYDSNDYNKALAWLDTRIGKLGVVALNGTIGVVTLGLWLFLNSKKPEGSMIYPRYLHTAADMGIKAFTLFCLVACVLFLAQSALGLLVFPLCLHARRKGKIVRLHPTVVAMLKFQLRNYGVDHRRAAVVRWLADKKPRALVKANNTWVNNKQQHGDDTARLQSDDNELSATLGELVAACNESKDVPLT